MRLERSSLIAITLLFMAGCSANRQARQADNGSDSNDPVFMPMRHVDEYDAGAGNHEFEAAPSSGDRPDPSRTPVAPPVPMREPVAAPPAIGVSRVKSVSWLRGARHTSESNNCGDDACGDSCSTGQQMPFPADYFNEGCGTTPETAKALPARCREKTNLAEVMHGWNLRAKTHWPKRVQMPHNCGEGTSCEPGLIMPEGCNSSVKDRKSNHHSPPVAKQYIGGVPVDPSHARHGNHGGSLADPLQENGWHDHTGSHDQRFSPDELLDLPSTLETPIKEQSPQTVPTVPTALIPEPVTGLPVPESATKLILTPAIQTPDTPAAVPEQVNPDSVKRIEQPPMWPRLGSAAATSVNARVAAPAGADDASLPVIQPGRGI